MPTLETIRRLSIQGKSTGLQQVASDLKKVAAAQDGVAAASASAATVTETSSKRQLSASRAWGRMKADLDGFARAAEQYARAQRIIDQATQQTLATQEEARRALTYHQTIYQDAGIRSAQRMGVAQTNLNDLLGVNSFNSSAREAAATFQAELDRLDEIARQKALQIGQDFHNQLDASMGLGGSAGRSARDSAAVFSAELDRLDEIAAIKARQIGQTFTTDLNQSFGLGGMGKSASASAAVFQEAARAEEEMQRQAKALRAEIDPVGTAQAALNEKLVQYRTLADAGAISAREFAAGEALVAQRMAVVEREAIAINGALSLNRAGLMELRAAGVNTFQALAAGMDPFQVALMEGSQVLGAFAQGTEGGLLAGLKKAGSAATSAGTALLSGFMTPVGAISGGFAAAGAAVLVYESYVKSGIPDADEVLKQHKAFIDEIAAAYPEAAKAAKEYEDQLRKLPTSVVAAHSENDLANQQKLLDSYRSQITSGLAFIHAGGEGAASNLGQYGAAGLAAFKKLDDEWEHGKLTIEQLLDQIGKLESDRGLNPASHSLLQYLEGIAKSAADATAQIGGTQKAADALFHGATPLPINPGEYTGGEDRQKQLIDQQNRLAQMRRESAAQLQEINARTVAQQAEAASAAVRAQPVGEGETPVERNYKAAAASSAVFAQATRDATDALRAAQDAMKTAGLDSYARSLAEINVQIGRQIELNPENAQTWQAVADAQRAALDMQTRKQLTDPLQEQLRSLQAEAASVGLSDDAHRRLQATLDAENTLRRQGISLGSDFAKSYEHDVVALSDYAQAVDKATAATDTLKQGGSQAIDDLVNGLADGASSISDVFGNVAKDIEKSLLQLAVSNPLKSMLLGGNLPTLSDLWSHPQAPTLSSTALGTLGTMANPMYVVPVASAGLGGTGSIFDKILGGGHANENYMPGAVTRAALPPIGTAAAAIRSIESSGNYSALGPLTKGGDRAYGAYQVMGANIPAWTEQAVGYRMTPSQFLSAPWAQDAVFNHQFGGYMSRYGMDGAAQAWFGGPGSVGRGGNVADILGTTGSAYVEKFNTALRGLTTTTGTAASGLTQFSQQAVPAAAYGLGNLGNGFDTFGKNLSNYFPPAPAGGGMGSGGGLFGNLFSGIGNFFRFGGSGQAFMASFTPGMYAAGTDYAPGGLAIVGEQGPELLNLPMGAKVVPNHRMMSFLAANTNSGPARPAANSSGDVSVVVHNHGEPVNATAKQTTDANGNRQVEIMLDKKINDRVLRPSSPTNKQLRSAYGLSQQVMRR
ncbi:MAG: hypothetical protein ACTHJ3_07710 [Pararhizobium sp.]